MTFPNIQRLLLINQYAWYAKGTNESTLYPPIGLSYVAATTESHGVLCSIIDAAVLKLNVEQCISHIKKFYFRISKSLDILSTIRSWRELLWDLDMIIGVIKNIRL